MVLRRTCSLWKLDVLAIALTLSSIASKPSACQSRQHVKSDLKRQKPPFAHCMYFFFAEACRFGRAKLFFTELCCHRDRLGFFISSVAFSVSHRSHPETTRSVSKQTRNTPSLFKFSNCQTQAVPSPYSMRTPVFRALPSGLNYRAASLSLLRYVDSTMRVRVVDWWLSVSNLQLAALTF